MTTKTFKRLVIIILVVTPLACSQHESEDYQKIFLDKKNKYFSIIPPPEWTQKNYKDNRTKVSWHHPADERILIRVIARKAAETYEDLKKRIQETSAQWAAKGVTLKEFVGELGGTRTIGLEGDVSDIGTTQLLFFIVNGVHFNCQYAAPTHNLYNKYLEEAMYALQTIHILPEQTHDTKKRELQELSWYKRYSYLLEQMGDVEAAKTLAADGLKKFPKDHDLHELAGNKK